MVRGLLFQLGHVKRAIIAFPTIFRRGNRVLHYLVEHARDHFAIDGVGDLRSATVNNHEAETETEPAIIAFGHLRLDFTNENGLDDLLYWWFFQALSETVEMNSPILDQDFLKKRAIDDSFGRQQRFETIYIVQSTTKAKLAHAATKFCSSANSGSA